MIIQEDASDTSEESGEDEGPVARKRVIFKKKSDAGSAGENYTPNEWERCTNYTLNELRRC